MATSTYDVNVQLALATTAEHEGDLDTALDFLASRTPAFTVRSLRCSS